MKQSRVMSLVESVVNILAGFGISLAAQVFFLPLLGVSISFSQNLQFALIMTAVSIARSYLLRRVFEALHIRRPLSAFMQACIAERYRQIEGEGWSREHDLNEHLTGELGNAGACYIKHAGAAPGSPAPAMWRWDEQWWKPAGIRRDLVRGVALAIAEGERFDQLKARAGKRQ